MKFRPTEPGVYISAALHGALLLTALVSFSDSRKFEDAAEAIPVDMITESQFNEVVKGLREAPPAETPKPVVDRVAEVEESKPQPVVQEVKVDVPAPPPPMREPDPAPPEPPQAAAPPEPAPPVPTPPPRPPEPKVEVSAKPEPPKPEPPKPVTAEAVLPPTPPPRPRELAKIEPPKVAPPKPTPPKPEPPKVPPKPALDRAQITALLDKQRKEDEAKKPPRPPSGREATEQRKFDPNSIAKLLSKEEPGQRASTGRALNQTASLGNPTASGQRMSPSLWGQLDGYMIDQYKRCWSYMSLGPTARFIPQIEVSFTSAGVLAREPRLRNQPSDPNLRALADSAMRAVKQCNPLRIPAQFLPYYNEWKDRILRFDPDEMSG
ncbi:MAG: cell envelope biogenesis protein TolA [Beijerinckiaceae bacterium]|nr:cell envelope biogenesis protein TolA [Beijerinckiaceae bacterium]